MNYQVDSLIKPCIILPTGIARKLRVETEEQLPALPALLDTLPYILPLPYNIITMCNKILVTNLAIQQLINYSSNCFVDKFDESIRLY